MYELLNLTTRKMWTLYKKLILQCMGTIFCVELPKIPIYTYEYFTYALKVMQFIEKWKFQSSQIYEFVSVFKTTPVNTYMR